MKIQTCFPHTLIHILMTNLYWWAPLKFSSLSLKQVRIDLPLRWSWFGWAVLRSVPGFGRDMRRSLVARLCTTWWKRGASLRISRFRSSMLPPTELVLLAPLLCRRRASLEELRTRWRLLTLGERCSCSGRLAPASSVSTCERLLRSSGFLHC